MSDVLEEIQGILVTVAGLSVLTFGAAMAYETLTGTSAGSEQEADTANEFATDTLEDTDMTDEEFLDHIRNY